MRLEDRRVQRLAGGALYEFGRAPARGLAMDMLAEPGKERREIAAADGGRDSRVRAPGGVVKLGRGHGAKGIGREIAPGADKPMDVLEAAFPVAGRRQAEQFLHPVIPGTGQ